MIGKIILEILFVSRNIEMTVAAKIKSIVRILLQYRLFLLRRGAGNSIVRFRSRKNTFSFEKDSCFKAFSLHFGLCLQIRLSELAHKNSCRGNEAPAWIFSGM